MAWNELKKNNKHKGLEKIKERPEKSCENVSGEGLSAFPKRRKVEVLLGMQKHSPRGRGILFHEYRGKPCNGLGPYNDDDQTYLHESPEWKSSPKDIC